MLREAALGLGRPILVVTALAREAEALASEVGFFLDEPPERDPLARRVHLLPAWELKPFAHLSPPPQTQAAQLAALYAALRGEAPMLVASAEALLMRTIPRPVFESSVHADRRRRYARPRSADRRAERGRLPACAADRGAGRLQRARRNHRHLLAALPQPRAHRAGRGHRDLGAPVRPRLAAIARRGARGDRDSHAPGAADRAQGRQGARARGAARERDRPGAQGAGGAERLADQRAVVPGRRVADSAAVRPPARHRLQLSARRHGGLDNRAGTRAGRGDQGHRANRRRGRGRAEQAFVLPGARVALPRRRRIRRRAGRDDRGRGRLAGHRGRAARRMGAARSKSNASRASSSARARLPGRARRRASSRSPRNCAKCSADRAAR